MPRALERICLKALAADPRQRYASAAALGCLRRPRCWDKTVRLWNLETGKEIGRLSLSVPVLSVALTKDGRHVLLGSNDGKLRYWDLRAEKESRAFAGPAEIWSMASL